MLGRLVWYDRQLTDIYMDIVVKSSTTKTGFNMSNFVLHTNTHTRTFIEWLIIETLIQTFVNMKIV